MLKDYILQTAPQVDEAERAERHWTAIWDKTPLASAKAIAALKRREEYRVMRPFLKTFPGGSVLDAGCGLGEWTLFLADQGFETIGLDISEETITRLRERHPRARFVQADVRDTGLASASLDAVLSWGVFEHFEEGPGDCLNESWRVLRPGGHLFMTVPFHNLRHFLGSMRHGGRTGVAPDAPLAFYQWRLTPAELDFELVRAGFEVKAMRPIHLQEGLRRFLALRAGLKSPLLLNALSFGLAGGLSLVLPRFVACHMLMAVARKPDRSRP